MPEDSSSPATIEQIPGTELNGVILTADAAETIGIETAPVRDTQVSGTPRTVIPYAAVLYDTQGATWTYTNPRPLTFVRHSIEIDYIAGRYGDSIGRSPLRHDGGDSWRGRVVRREFEFEEE